MCSCHQLAFASAVWSSPLTFHEGVTNNRILPMNDSCLWLTWILMFIYFLVQHRTCTLYLKCKAFTGNGIIFPGNKQDFTQSRMCCVEHTVPLDGEPAEQQWRRQSLLYCPVLSERWKVGWMFVTRLLAVAFGKGKALWFWIIVYLNLWYFFFRFSCVMMRYKYM